MPVSHEILASVTRALLGAVDGRGVVRSQLLDSAGLREDELSDADDWVPIAKHARVGRAIMTALPGENLGLATGTRIYGDPRGALGYVLRRSGDNLQALRNFFAYQSVVNRAMEVELAAGAAGSSVVLRMVPELAAICHPAEALFSAWVGIARHLTGTRWCPESVAFTHPAQGDPREHEAFFGCAVRFEHSRTELVIPDSANTLVIASAAHELDAVLPAARDAATSVLGGVDERHALDGAYATLSAQRIAVHDHATDSAAQTAARLAFAHGLLRSSRLFVYEAAFLLGFTDLRAFEQLFRARYAADPRTVRAQS